MSSSLQSRVDNLYQWTRKLVRLTSITVIQVETVRFDAHKLVNPEVAGVVYQEGELFGYPAIQTQARQPLRDAAAVNATRYAIGKVLKSLGLPVGFWSGGRTKYNRVQPGANTLERGDR